MKDIGRGVFVAHEFGIDDFAHGIVMTWVSAGGGDTVLCFTPRMTRVTRVDALKGLEMRIVVCLSAVWGGATSCGSTVGSTLLRSCDRCSVGCLTVRWGTWYISTLILEILESLLHSSG